MSQVPPGNYPPQSNYSTPANKPMGLAVAAMVVGILSIFPGCCLNGVGLGLILGIVAVVLGIMAQSQAAQGRAGGRGMAIAGLITGSIGALLGLVMLGIVLFGGPALQRKMNVWNRQLQQQMDQQKQQEQQQQPATTSPAP